MALVGVSLPLVAGYLGRMHPALDSFGHFRAHLGVALAVVGIIAVVARARIEGIVALMLGLGSVGTTIDWPWLQPPGPALEAGEPRYRLLQMNLRFDNAEMNAVLSLVARTAPDVVTFEEVSAAWEEKLVLLSSAYPYRIVCPRTDVVGSVAILSKRPFTPDRTPECFGDGALAIARVDFGGRGVDIAALHLFWPWPNGQSGQLTRLAEPLATLGTKAVLGGDFNATSWSNAVGRVETAGVLKRVPGSGRTWLHRRLPNALRRIVGLPIDHVMANEGIRPISLEALGHAGSDHLPLLLTFAVNGVSGDAGSEVALLTTRSVQAGPSD